jgi:RHS repeat-associated protein
MPGPYNLSVPSGANSFNYGTNASGQAVSYSSGSQYTALTACDALAFYNAFSSANPGMGRANDTPNAWQNADEECAAQTAAPPPPTTASPPVESNPVPAGGDGGDLQGAPPQPPTVTAGSDGGTPNPPPTQEPTRPPVGDPHPTRGGEQPQQSTNAGDPVDLFSGAFYLEETDLTIPNTLLPLSFTRLYKSGAAAMGPLGWNWDHNFNLFIRELNTGDIAVWRNLHEDIFKFNGLDFDPPRGIFEKLEPVTGLIQAYEIKEKGGLVLHFERPSAWLDAERIPLVWTKDQHGNQLKFTYGAEDKLAEVRDDDDRFFHLEYDVCGLLVAVLDHAGRKFLYEHDEQTMQLTYVESPAISDHPNGISRIYHYEQPWAMPELRHNIVRIEDGKGNIYLENTYEQDPASISYARVTEQLYGGFLYQFQYTQLQYVPTDAVFINIPALRVEVMNPDYGLETYTFNYRGDLLDRRYRLNKDKSFRVVAWLYEFDEQGNLAKTTSPSGSDEINIFDFANPDPRMRSNLFQKEITAASGFPSPSRIIWKGKYEPNYQLLIEEKNETNKVITYKYDSTGKLLEVIQPDATLPDGSTQVAKTSFTYNSKGQMLTTVLADGTQHENEYGSIGNEKSRLIKYRADVANLNIEQQYKYDANGFTTETIDGNGNSTKQIYNVLGLLEKEIQADVNGITTETILHYDTDKKVIGSEKPKGSFTDAVITGNFIIDQFERDVLGHPTKLMLSNNTSEAKVFHICNDYRGFPVETLNPDGSKIRKTFDERGLSLTEEVIGIDGQKITSKKVYNRLGTLIQETNAFGLTTYYEYDAFARISKTTLPNGSEIRNKWLKNDLLESEEVIGDDGSGTIRQLSFKSYTYDEKNRRITETVKIFTNNPLISTNSTTTHFYDELDRIVKSINHRGGISTIKYDGLGRTTITIDPEGNEQHATFDHNGNLVQADNHHLEPNGSVSILTKQFKYDARDRRTEIIEPDGAKVVSEYDDRNLLVKQTDYLGVVLTNTFDSFNNKTKEVKDDGGLNIVQQWKLDSMSRIVAFIDPTSQVSTYQFDSVGRNIQTSYPNGFSSSKQYNTNNQLIKEQLASGAVFVYTYDLANRISKIENTVSPAPLIPVARHEFLYDGLGKVLNAKVGTEIVDRKYDSIGRLLTEKTLGATIDCVYDDVLGTVEKTWPDGRKEKLSHNLNGVLTTIEETASGLLGSGHSLIASFKASGPVAFGEASYQGGLSLANTYDERKRLTEIAMTGGTIHETVKYRYNIAGLKKVEAILGQNPKISYFEFDNKYRLLTTKDSFTVSIPNAVTQAEHNTAITTVMLAAAGAPHTENFLYNAADSRIKYTETGVPDKNYSYLPGHKIQNDGLNAYTHHPDGMLKTDGTFNYEADALGRIVTIKSGINIITEFTYDVFGRPSLVKEVGKPVKSYHYLGGFVEQINEDGTPQRQVTIHPATGVPIAYHTPLGTHYTLFDSRYNLIGLADATGNLVETYRYKSFGVPTIFNSAGVTIATSAFGIEPIYGGQRYLAASGFYLSKRRLMNPVNGLFLSIDPKGYIDSSSLYIYVGQNPIDYTDPDGEFAFLAILAVMAVGALVSGGINAVRQGIAISEGSQEGWEWGQFGMSVGIGAIAAPILVVAPELAVPLAALGVAGGIDQISQGHYGTGAFDIVTSIAPFGFKGPRGSTFGSGTRFGQMRGLGETASWNTRVGRFDLIGRGISNFRPSISGRRIGLGFSRGAPGGREGHVAVTFDGEGTGMPFIEKNGDSFRGLPELPEFYIRPRPGRSGRPFEYDSIRIPRASTQRAQTYAGERSSISPFEGFDQDSANCSHFGADVLNEAGFRNFGTGRGSGLWSNFRNFGIARDMAYSAPFFTSGIHPNETRPSAK